MTKEGFSYTNRLRIDDFQDMLSKYGFETIELTKNIYEGELPDKKMINRKFEGKDAEKLKVIGITLLAKKNGS